MRRFFRFVLPLIIAVTVLPAPLPVRGVDDGDKAAAESHSDDSSQPAKPKKKKKKSKPKPKPARPKSKKKKSEPEPTPHRKAHPKPEAEPEPTPHHKPQPTPEPTATPEQKPKQETPTPGPSVTPAPATATTGPAAVVVQKSGDALDEEPAATPTPARGWRHWLFGEKTPQYRYLTKEVRNVIDHAPVARHRWRYIVVHNSGTRQGNAKAFDYYHLHVRKMPNGLAYHFVIGNGTSSGNGAIEIGNRWVRQIDGGHVHSDYLNSIALGICLVGDFNTGKPTQQQLDALDELIRYLRSRVGRTEHKLAIVKAHKDINPPRWPTDCPGDKFPYNWLYSRFD